MLKQGLSQKLLQKLSPQQIQLMKLLQVPTVNLDQRIKEEIEVNPALEEEEQELPQEEEMIFMKDAEKYIAESIKETNDENTISETNDPAESIDDELEPDDIDISEYLINDSDNEYENNTENSYNIKQESRSIPSAETTFQEYLMDQIQTAHFDEKEKLIGLQIIGSIDEDGYLRRSIEAMVDDIMFAHNIACTESEIENILIEIHGFDPPGVGARDLKECLSLQLERAHHDLLGIKLARQIIDEYFEQFTKKHYKKIQKSVACSEEELKIAIDLLLHLNPKPGSTFERGTKKETYIIPDFYIIENSLGKLEIGLNARNAPELRINEGYRNMMKSYEKKGKNDPKQKEAVQFIKSKIDSAKWFIEAIRQRQRTMLNTMETILAHQYDFFLSGDETKIKPMILKDIAEVTGLDISTVSRVANSKYVQTEFGVFLLKYFFSESLSTDTGEEVSTREVKKILQDIIETEGKNKPLSDQKLTGMLQKKGYNIARRTVAKYREQLGISVARLRKEL